MIQLEPLWIYQQADLALDRFENGLKKSPTRTKLFNVRNAVMEQQNRIKRLEADLQKALDECSRIAADVQMGIRDSCTCCRPATANAPRPRLCRWQWTW